jgi:glutamate dehydrogenase (NADP+)
LKNSLTTLSLGGGKGGSDFDPKGCSENEVMRFCQSFMTELVRHIGPDRDVPAGDIGVGGREVGYLFGQYKRMTARFQGVLTGKGQEYGGSLFRPEATGYGAVYFANEILKAREESEEPIKGKTAIVSGAGNVAQFAVQKLLQMGATVLTMSDSGGYVHDLEGIDEEKLEWVMELKNERRGALSEYPEQFPSGKYYKGERPWGVKADLAFPSATQNEVEEEGAKSMVDNGLKLLVECANMPCTAKAQDILQKGGVWFGPAKAANAGGVGVSGLEMAQNSQRQKWSAQKVDELLHEIMQSIHEACVEAAKEVGAEGDLATGANVAGFVKVADAMIAQGAV